MTLIITGAVAIILIDLIPLIRKRAKRAIIAFSVMFAVTVTLAVLQVKGIKVPSIMHFWRKVVTSLGLNYKGL